jgi:hypothetical protein
MSDRTNKLTRPTVFTVTEVMERWGLSDRAVRRLVADGTLQTIKGKGPVRILRASVEQQEGADGSQEDVESEGAKLASELPQQSGRLGVVPTVIALVQPRMLSRKRAAAYCGVSVPMFNAWCPVMPVRASSRVLLYDRVQIDRWLDALSYHLPGNDESANT